MTSLKAQRLLERAIHNYFCERGLNRSAKVFLHEYFANPKTDAINSSDEAFLKIWWDKFYEEYNAKFPKVCVLKAESFDKVAQVVEDVVTNNGPTNQIHASDNTGVNISSMMPINPSPFLMESSSVMESINPDLMNAEIFDFFSIDMSSSHDGYQMETIPPDWNARVDKHDINLGGHMLRETNINAPANALPALPEHPDAGIPFKIHNVQATNCKLLCCHFNSQGDLLATIGNDTKVLIWDLTNNNVNSLEGHTSNVTDVRFRPNSTVFATSSLDSSVKIWDAAKPSNHFQNLFNNDEHVMSIDFHPKTLSLLSSCGSNDEIKLWDINRGDCKLIFKGGSTQVRFQPQRGDLLASSTKNTIKIFNIEANNIHKELQGHVKNICSICWDISGNYLASVSEDSARIWCINEGKCIFELFSSGKKFQSCTFHPGYAQVLVIGSDKFIELWNPIYQSNVTSPYIAHAGIISSLSDSLSSGMIASVSHDQWIKIWK